MAGIHPVARSGFASDAERYEAGRPGYPSAAVAWLIEHLDITPASMVLDVGAGTGKLTRDLVPTGAVVCAVEPIIEMGRVARRTAPGSMLVGATGERLPFGDRSVDAITVAQAFHWFDAERAWTEFGRVLRHGGGVGLIWNARDRSLDWVDEVWSIMDAVEKHAPWRDHGRTQLEVVGPARSRFGEVAYQPFRHQVQVTRQSMIDRVASVSHVAVLPEPERQVVLDRVAATLPADEPLVMPYRTDVYATRLT